MKPKFKKLVFVVGIALGGAVSGSQAKSLACEYCFDFFDRCITSGIDRQQCSLALRQCLVRCND